MRALVPDIRHPPVYRIRRRSARRDAITRSWGTQLAAACGGVRQCVTSTYAEIEDDAGETAEAGMEFVADPTDEQAEEIERGLGERPATPVRAVVVESGRVVAGLDGAAYWGKVHVRLLWVDPAHRSKGLGRRLMSWAEQRGRGWAARRSWSTRCRSRRQASTPGWGTGSSGCPKATREARAGTTSRKSCRSAGYVSAARARSLHDLMQVTIASTTADTVPDNPWNTADRTAPSRPQAGVVASAQPWAATDPELPNDERMPGR